MSPIDSLPDSPSEERPPAMALCGRLPQETSFELPERLRFLIEQLVFKHLNMRYAQNRERNEPARPLA